MGGTLQAAQSRVQLFVVLVRWMTSGPIEQIQNAERFFFSPAMHQRGNLQDETVGT